MTTEQIHLLQFALSILAFSGVWWKLRINSDLHTKSIDTLTAAKEAHMQEITDLKISMAEKYVSKNDMKEVEAGIGEKIDERTGSLERLITSLFGGTPPTPPTRRKTAP